MGKWEVMLQTTPAIVTALVAVTVAVLTYRQWKTAQEKLRLDLYNRRFDIYTKYLDFCQALLLWDGTPEQVALQKPFLKAFRESRFLFPKGSGVYGFLDEFQKNAHVIVQFENLKPLDRLGQDEAVKQGQRKLDSVNWILSSLEPLEEKMAPYLDFHRL